MRLAEALSATDMASRVHGRSLMRHRRTQPIFGQGNIVLQVCTS